MSLFVFLGVSYDKRLDCGVVHTVIPFPIGPVNETLQVSVVPPKYRFVSLVSGHSV